MPNTEYSLHFYFSKEFSAEVYETHCGTEKGCFETEEAPLKGIEADSLADLFYKVDEYIVDFEKELSEYGGVLKNVYYYDVEDRQ